MTRLIGACSIIAVCILVPLHVQATTYNAASCSRADVGSAVALAVDGDTVIMPACAQTNWTTRLVIYTGINFQGAGEGVTIIGDDVAKNTGIPGSQCSGTQTNLLHMLVSGTQPFTVSNFSIVGVSPDNAICSKGHIVVAGTVANYRFHHITLTDARTQMFVVYNPSGGLIDHITHTGANQQGFQIVGGVYGDTEWATDMTWGDPGMLYIEDSSFADTTNGQHGLTDCYAGARYVSRYNTVTNLDVAGSHGTDTSGRRRGCRRIEAYRNTGIWTFGADRGQQTRGGTSRVFDNVITGSTLTNMVKAVNFRDSASYSPWLLCNGTSGYDENQGGQTGYRCVDQPGAGKSNNLGNVLNPAVAWVGNALDPIYVWGNTFNGAANNTVGTSAHVLAERDYYTYSSATGSPQTVGVRVGTLASRPAGCTAGVGYWATDQGTWNQSSDGRGSGLLYLCTATDTWTLSYTPYTYPHPLQGPPSPPAPDPLTDAGRIMAFSGNTFAIFTWPASTDANHKRYNVYRCLSPGVCTNLVKQITTTSAAATYSPETRFFDSSLYLPTTYYFSVSDINIYDYVGPATTAVPITVTGKQ